MLGEIVPELGDGIRAAFFMFWETLWPIILGFVLSGAIQAFASHERMRRALGNHGLVAVAKASGLGMISSSCSYAASAMAKSLFQKGADFTTSMVFMFASTNLVVELGVVLIVLLGWQFAAAEFVGGPIMIALVVLLGGFVFAPRIVAEARLRLARDDALSTRTSEPESLGPAPVGVRGNRLSSRAAWSDAASYTIADLKMLRRELLLGYLVAGLLSVFVPSSAWNAVFIRGHGGWTVVENVAVAPVIAFGSFVCSIGNVPMAAALWKGGISFGGVISFLFADLLAAPLVLIYRRYYGGQLAVRLVGLFWLVMAGAGLIVQAIFATTGLISRRRPTEITPIAFHWNSTFVLNAVSVVVLAGVYWAYRNRSRFGGGEGFALDPVCGMQVQTAHAPATGTHAGQQFWFCSDRCAERFAATPSRFLSRSGTAEGLAETEETKMAKDPVCGMSVDPATAAAIRTHDGRNYFFCALSCAETFDRDPARYVAAPASDIGTGGGVNT